MDREKVGQVMLVPVTTSVHYLPSLVQHRPRQVPGYGHLLSQAQRACLATSFIRFGDTDLAPGDTGLLPHVLQ